MAPYSSSSVIQVYGSPEIQNGCEKNLREVMTHGWALEGVCAKTFS